MTSSQPHHPLHGITRERMVTQLGDHVGRGELTTRVHIRWFSSLPRVGSSLTFRRRTPWAREQVECLDGFIPRQRARRARRPEPTR